MVNLGEIFPNFTADTTDGAMVFHEYVGNSWCILFSHPADYTPVCTTELTQACQLVPEFTKRNVKLCALSCDDVESHKGWIGDIKSYGNLSEFPYPIISDKTRCIATRLKMIDPDEKDIAGMPLTARAVFIVGPDKKLKLSILYPATTGRNFNEILRVVDSLQLTAEHKVATPVNWKPGEKCMVVPSVREDEEAKLFPTGVEKISVPSKKCYLRMTACPKLNT
ncbi:peroxiredoxin-6 [Octopus bimaculoides]|uniref:Thioredoxin domain-containing protein n=1 Tax=Octopus bimaculoides TaxID=37653 RepID=A0A0L8FK99_OCTBM|nr:peroxiredoxin-6 [Octopus bimaculoides]|eukprot:XP_014789068.1 PREDICTED: peroxiredoxin-6-like [Octopus bimaculoides]